MGVEAANKVNKENRYNPDYMRRQRMTKIRMALNLYQMEPKSLSERLVPGDDNSSQFADVLVDEAETAEARAMRLQTYAHLRQVMHEALTPREERILLLRFGFEDELTLDQIGQKGYFDLSRERIRQVESKALDKLRRALRQL